MRVALVQPPFTEGHCLVPTGILGLASYIKRYQYQPSIVDLNIYLRKHLYSPDYFKRVAKLIIRQRPQILGFTVMCSTLATVLLIAKECKNISPDTPIVLGGPEVSFEEAALLKNFKQVDVVVRGEGEITFLELLQALEKEAGLSSVLGITFRDRKRIIRNPDRPLIDDLDSLPEVDYTLLSHLNKYEQGGIEAGRGCPYQCTFCSTCRMWKRTFRIKSPKRLAAELKTAYSIFGGNEDYIPITHDNLLASRTILKDYLARIADSGIVWSCSARLDHLDEKLIKGLKKAGCRAIFLGIESGSPETQKIIKKNLPLHRLPQILDQLYQEGIEAWLSFIIGFPGETKGQINQTLGLLLRTRVRRSFPVVQLHSFAFNKGSELYFNNRRRFNKLRFVEGQTDWSPFITNLPAERALVRKHPRIFPSYYFLERGGYPADFIKQTCIVFSFLTQVFPFTTYLLLDSMTLQPVQFCEKIIEYFNQQRVEWKICLDETKAMKYYTSLVGEYVKKHGNTLIRDIFSHEVVFAKSNSLRKPGRNCSKIRMNSRPKLQSGVKLRNYCYDVITAINNRQLVDVSGEAAKYYVAYVPGEEAKAIPLPPSLYYLLLLCKGELSVGDIISGIQDGNKGAERTRKIVLQKIKYLQKQGLISVV